MPVSLFLAMGTFIWSATDICKYDACLRAYVLVCLCVCVCTCVNTYDQVYRTHVTFMVTYLLTYSLHGAESFLRS